MSTEHGLPPTGRPAGFFERLLWMSAGADADLLARCPHGDRVKYQGIGGIVLATSALAFLSGSYAFYTVFAPKDETVLSRETHYPTVLAALAVGAIWALIIFNLDRFIVSSTGKGDGTERITWSELVSNFPRLVMALIIGICISAPLEIRVLKPEIEAQLELEQQQYLDELNARVEQETAARKTELRQRIEAAQKRLDDSAERFEQRRLEIKAQLKQLEQEAEGLTASGTPGRGPAWRDKKATLDRLEQELDRDRADAGKRDAGLMAELVEWKAQIDQLDQRLAETRRSNLKQSRSLDGLLKRIQISHEIGGSIPFWIAALLLSIEMGPIFFKMMLSRGTYDYMEENRRRVARAHLGIETESRVFTDGRTEVRVDVFHEEERLLAEERRRSQTEAQLATAVHDAFRERTAAEIREDPERFLDPPVKGTGS